MSQWFRMCLAGVALLLLWGCATPSPNAPAHKTRSDALLAQQIEQAREAWKVAAQSPEPRLLFAGVAMDDRSEAFRHDVLLAESVVRTIDPQAVVLRLVNPMPGQDADLPYATPDNIAQVLQTLATLARPQDKVMVLLTSHGAPGFLAVHAGMQPQSLVSSMDLRLWLAPLQDRPTLLVISACFSGSLIAPLAQKQRIILTAAAANRASFGCDSKSDNTYFVKSLFKQPHLPAQSIRTAMQEAMVGVSALEKEMNLAPPSMPQAYYGSATQNWARQPIGQWLQAAETADAPEDFKATP